MKIKNLTKFHIKCLNQEKLLNDLCRTSNLFDIERVDKYETYFKCEYFEHKKIEKLLKSHNIEILEIKHQGIAYQIKKSTSAVGFLLAVILFFLFYSVQYQFVWKYQILGTDKLSQTEIVQFVSENFSKNKHKLDTQNVEISLLNHFHQISFASCAIKGQTLVINIKEKLLPDEIYGDFKPIVAEKDGKIKEINLISGTLNVKVGDIVQKGDVLVEPYTIDTSGQIKKVEAKAEILAEVYNEGSVDHYQSYIEVRRTGRVANKNEIKLFGLNIYSFKDNMNFDMYDVEFEDVSLVKNLFLPFKMRKTIYYELEEVVIESVFEDVKEEYVEKAREKALENCQNCDTIIEEFYTVRHLSGVTIVNFCIVTNEVIGGYK